MQQGSKEWLELRRGKIGASEVAIIMGLSPKNWNTNPLKLWRQKMGLEPDTKKTAAMQKGLDLEPEAREIFNREMGIDMVPDVVISSQHEGMMASLDGISPCRKIILEIKCNGKDNHLLAIEKQIPVYYRCQIQYQLYVTQAEIAYYMSYHEKEWIILEVTKDDAMIAEILKAVLEFWRRMKEFDPPDGPLSLCVRDDLEYLEEIWVRNDVIEKEANEKKKKALQLMKEKAEGESFVGKLLQLTKYRSEGRVQYQDIPELKSIDLDQYRGPEVESWRVTLKKVG